MDFAELNDLTIPSFVTHREQLGQEEEVIVAEEEDLVQKVSGFINQAVEIYHQVSEKTKPSTITIPMEEYHHLVRENFLLKKRMVLMEQNTNLTFKDQVKLKAYELMPQSMIAYLSGEPTLLSNAFGLIKQGVEIIFILNKIRGEKQVIKKLWEIGLVLVGVIFN